MNLRGLLMPLAPLYAAGQRIDRAMKSRNRYVSALPVISVGNLSVGGSGKTPLVMHLAERLQGECPLLVLSRGHGRADMAERLWSPGDPSPDPALFGDEPALVAHLLSNGALGVARDRGAFLRRIEGRFPGHVVLLDDGFQHYSLARDLDIVIVDERTVRHPRLLPAGDLREPLRALRRAGLILATSDAAGELADRWRAPDTPILGMRQESAGITLWSDGPAGENNMLQYDVQYDGAPALALCGIARPERFFESLNNRGVNVVSRVVYGDHHRYTSRDAERMLAQMRRDGARVLLTTAKDAVKLVRFPKLRDHLFVAHLRVVIEQEEQLLAMVRRAVQEFLVNRA